MLSKACSYIWFLRILSPLKLLQECWLAMWILPLNFFGLGRCFPRFQKKSHQVYNWIQHLCLIYFGLGLFTNLIGKVVHSYFNLNDESFSSPYKERHIMSYSRVNLSRIPFYLSSCSSYTLILDRKFIHFIRFLAIHSPSHRGNVISANHRSHPRKLSVISLNGVIRKP